MAKTLPLGRLSVGDRVIVPGCSVDGRHQAAHGAIVDRYSDEIYIVQLDDGREVLTVKVQRERRRP